MTFAPMLDTRRLHLRGLVLADIAFVRSLICDPEVRRFLGGPVPLVRQWSAVSGYFRTASGEATWLVRTKDAHRSIGMVFLSNHKDGMDTELSYQFRRDAWGKGFASEATRRVMDYALHDLHLSHLIAETQSANRASCRLLERLGMMEQRRVQRFGAEQVIYATKSSAIRP